jgi:hypothetical protein
MSNFPLLQAAYEGGAVKQENGSDLYRQFQRHVPRLSNRMKVTGGVRASDEVSALEQAAA